MALHAYDYTTNPDGYFPAFHWDGSIDSTNALAKFVGDSDLYGECDFFEIEYDNGDTLEILPGDYVIPGYGGRFSVMDELAFEDYFAKV